MSDWHEDYDAFEDEWEDDWYGDWDWDYDDDYLEYMGEDGKMDDPPEEYDDDVPF